MLPEVIATRIEYDLMQMAFLWYQAREGRMVPRRQSLPRVPSQQVWGIGAEVGWYIVFRALVVVELGACT